MTNTMSAGNGSIDPNGLDRLIVLGLGEEVKKTTKPVGGEGRPYDPRWTEKPPVPMSPETKEELEWLSGVAGIGYTQLAARIIETALSRAELVIANAAQGPRGNSKSPASYYVKLIPTVRHGLDETKLTEALKLLPKDDWAELFSDLASPTKTAGDVLAEFMGKVDRAEFIVFLQSLLLEASDGELLTSSLQEEIGHTKARLEKLLSMQEQVIANAENPKT